MIFYLQFKLLFMIQRSNRHETHRNGHAGHRNGHAGHRNGRTDRLTNKYAEVFCALKQSRRL